MSIVLSVKGLKKTFSEKKILEDVHFQMEKGERLALLGPGGCGKSTLLKIICGILEPDRGSVEILGQDLFSLSRGDKRKILKRICMAFQQGALFDFMNVEDNICFAMENMTSYSLEKMKEISQSMLEAVDLPQARLKLPSELSGGMRRRVGIVRAMCTEPELALLDEPTAGLDPVTSRIVIDMIHSLGQKTHSSLLCVTSSVEVAFAFSQKVGILHEGVLKALGTWDELHALQDPWLSSFLDSRTQGVCPQ